MKDLLSKHDLKMLLLLEELNQTRETLPIKKLSSELDMPTRTISNYVQEFNNYQLAITIHSNNKGLCLILPQETSFRYIYQIIYQNSLELNVLEQLFLADSVTVDELADQNFVSVSTIKRVIDRIKPPLKKEGITLMPARNELIGEEEKIRQLFNFFYIEKYNNLEFLNDTQKECLHQLIQRLFSEQGKKLYQHTLVKYTRWLYLNIIRLKNGHRVPLKKHKFKDSYILKDATFAAKFTNIFGIDLTSETLNDLFYQLNNNYFFDSYEDISRIGGPEASKIQTDIDRIRHNLQGISDDLHAPITPAVEQALILDFFNLTHFTNTRTFLLYDRRKIFLTHFSSKYPYVKEYLESYLTNLAGTAISDELYNELVYFLLTHWYELFNSLSKITPPVNIYIYVDTDLEHAFFIKKDLEKYCRYNIKCHIMMDLEKPVLTDQDILITTLAQTDTQIKNVLCFSDYFSERNWLNLHEQIEGILADKSYHL